MTRPGPVLADAFAFKPGAASRRLDFDVAKLAAFTLVMKPLEPHSRADHSVTVDYDRMVRICQSWLGQ